MRRLLPLALTVALSAGALVHAADDLVTSRFGDYLESLRAQAGIPALTATLVGLGGIDWERAFGHVDVERSVATRSDSPFHLDGTTQVLSAALLLRCAEEGRIRLDDRVASGTIRELLSHTSPGSAGPAFSYRPERLNELARVITSCTGPSLRAGVAEALERLGMFESVPGPDAHEPSEPITGVTRDRWELVLERLAKPYAVDGRGRPSLSQYPVRTLTPAGGLISTGRDMARFDLALKKGVLLRPESLGLAWNPVTDGNGQRLPHGLGWFVQYYGGERIVWQFGVGENASSSLIITVPGRGLTLILLANSSGLARPFSLAGGDVTVSPFARIFLSIFVR